MFILHLRVRGALEVSVARVVVRLHAVIVARAVAVGSGVGVTRRAFRQVGDRMCVAVNPVQTRAARRRPEFGTATTVQKFRRFSVELASKVS